MEKITKLAHEIFEQVEASDLSVLEKLTALKVANELLSLRRAEEIVTRYPESSIALVESASLLGSS